MARAARMSASRFPGLHAVLTAHFFHVMVARALARLGCRADD
jgi:hypothetical protein